jgi:hypothetical protein
VRINKPKIQRSAVSKELSRPAPILGWNAKEALSEMDFRSAIVLDNWFPTNTDVRVRKGSSDYVTGLLSCQTLMAWTSGTTKKLFAASDGSIFDVSSIGAVSAPAATNHSNSSWQHCQFENNSGGHFLIAANGSDSPQYYNGAQWDSLSISGIASSSKLKSVSVFKNRLFFVENNSLNIWYLPLSSIQGQAAKLNIGALARSGGNVRCCFAIPTTAGNAPDDYFGVVTDQGELFIFAGDDPSTATSWRLVGSFQTGRPIGWRCWTKWGDDVALLTDLGLVSVTSIVHSENTLGRLISDNIRDAIPQAIAAKEDFLGWQVIASTRDKQLIVNVPGSAAGESEQYVMNTDTGAWCRFLGWPAECFEVQDGRLYFGGTKGIRVANSGRSDAGEAIDADASTAYDYVNARGRNKHFKMIRPTFLADGSVSVSVSMGTDFGPAPLMSAPNLTEGGGSAYNSSAWDMSIWAQQPRPTRNWNAAGVDGDCVTTRVKVRTSAAEIKWMSTDLLYEVGGIL